MAAKISRRQTLAYASGRRRAEIKSRAEREALADRFEQINSATLAEICALRSELATAQLIEDALVTTATSSDGFTERAAIALQRAKIKPAKFSDMRHRKEHDRREHQAVRRAGRANQDATTSSPVGRLLEQRQAERKGEREQSADRIDPALRLMRPVKSPP